MKSDLVVGIDIGGTTGIGLRFADSKGQVIYRTSETHTPKELWLFLQDAKPDVIIFERFYTSGKPGRYGIYTIQLGGLVMGAAYCLPALLFRHTPQERRSMLTKAQGILKSQTSRFSQHELDALAHVLSWEWFSGGGSKDGRVKPIKTPGTIDYQQNEEWRLL